MIIDVIIALLMIGLLVVIHEFGHFIVAKANGVAVVEFSIGFGPKLISFVKGETQYSLKLIPFGGACVMLGDELMYTKDDGNEDDLEDDAYLPESDKRIRALYESLEENRRLNNKPVWVRIAIVAAGPIFNFLLAFVCAVVLISCVGTDPCIVSSVNENSAAYDAGVRVGDKIVKINSDKVAFAREFSFFQYYNPDKEFELTLKRDGETIKTVIRPEYVEKKALRIGIMIRDNNLIDSVLENSPAIEAGLQSGDRIVSVNGVAIDADNTVSSVIEKNGAAKITVEVLRDNEQLLLNVVPEEVDLSGYEYGFDCSGRRVKISVGETVVCAFYEVGYWIESVLDSLGMMFTGKVGVNDLSGPVGVVEIVSTTVQETRRISNKYAFYEILDYIIILSANLGVMNLLPLPALDGGRLLFMIIEVLRGKPVKKEWEGMVHFVGMVALMMLMVYLLFKDVYGLFS